jgi:non-ribosomal peptide synthetase component F
VITDAGTLTYAELAAAAASVTAALVNAGVTPGARVGMLADRDQHLLPILLGILGAGAAYVPLDPSFPAERLRFMIADAGVAVVATTAAVAAEVALPGVRTVLVDGLAPTAPPRGRGRRHR